MIWVRVMIPGLLTWRIAHIGILAARANAISRLWSTTPPTWCSRAAKRHPGQRAVRWQSTSIAKAKARLANMTAMQLERSVTYNDAARSTNRGRRKPVYAGCRRSRRSVTADLNPGLLRDG